jgi:hypothetical protein
MRVTRVRMQQILSNIFLFNGLTALKANNKFHFTDLKKTNSHIIQKVVLTKRERERKKN